MSPSTSGDIYCLHSVFFKAKLWASCIIQKGSGPWLQKISAYLYPSTVRCLFEVSVGQKAWPLQQEFIYNGMQWTTWKLLWSTTNILFLRFFVSGVYKQTEGNGNRFFCRDCLNKIPVPWHVWTIRRWAEKQILWIIQPENWMLIINVVKKYSSFKVLAKMVW